MIDVVLQTARMHCLHWPPLHGGRDKMHRKENYHHIEVIEVIAVVQTSVPTRI